MKLTITGEKTNKTLEELAEIIAQECHDVTLHVPTEQSIQQRADAIMHLAADMYVSAASLANADVMARGRERHSEAPKTL